MKYHFGKLQSDEPPTMQDALNTDLENGVAWMNEAESQEFAKRYPTVLAVAGFIDKEVERLKSQMDVLTQSVQYLQEARRHG